MTSPVRSRGPAGCERRWSTPRRPRRTTSPPIGDGTVNGSSDGARRFETDRVALQPRRRPPGRPLIGGSAVSTSEAEHLDEPVEHGAHGPGDNSAEHRADERTGFAVSDLLHSASNVVVVVTTMRPRVTGRTTLGGARSMARLSLVSALSGDRTPVVSGCPGSRTTVTVSACHDLGYELAHLVADHRSGRRLPSQQDPDPVIR